MDCIVFSFIIKDKAIGIFFLVVVEDEGCDCALSSGASCGGSSIHVRFLDL
jgi:hypothetical protein